MAIDRLLAQSATVKRRTGSSKDDRGNLTQTWETSSTISCRFWRRSGREDRDGRDVAYDYWHAAAEAAADVTTKDQVVAIGRTFEVVAVHQVYDRAGSVHHLALTLEEIA